MSRDSRAGAGSLDKIKGLISSLEEKFRENSPLRSRRGSSSSLFQDASGGVADNILREIMVIKAGINCPDGDDGVVNIFGAMGKSEKIFTEYLNKDLNDPENQFLLRNIFFSLYVLFFSTQRGRKNLDDFCNRCFQAVEKQDKFVSCKDFLRDVLGYIKDSVQNELYAESEHVLIRKYSIIFKGLKDVLCQNNMAVSNDNINPHELFLGVVEDFNNNYQSVFNNRSSFKVSEDKLAAAAVGSYQEEEMRRRRDSGDSGLNK